MIRFQVIHVSSIEDGPYRDSWKLSDNAKPAAITNLAERLADHLNAGGDFVIHVKEKDGGFVALDGHFLLDILRFLNRKIVNAVVHEDVKTIEQARAKYLSMNYLRSTDWMRDAVITREQLALAGIDTAVKVFADPELAKDLVTRDDTRWAEFKTVFYDEDAEASPMDAMFDGGE